jgi:hypothetical protein
MELSDVRKRVRLQIDQARRRASAHRDEADRAGAAFEALLPQVVASWKQVANILKAEGYAFTVHTPAGLVRLASDRAADDFIEVTLETARRPVAVVTRTRFARGRHVVERESIVAEGAAVERLDEERLLDVLLQELDPFVER